MDRRVMPNGAGLPGIVSTVRSPLGVLFCQSIGRRVVEADVAGGSQLQMVKSPH